MNKTDPHPFTPPAWLRRAARLMATAAGCGAGLLAAAQPLAIDIAAESVDGADATPATADSVWAEGDTVRDLLRADAQAARAARPPRQAADWLAPPSPHGLARASGAPAGNLSGHEAHPADRIDVMAIYGVGKALHADISVNGHVSRYRAGRAAPLASRPPAGEPYVLRTIEAPCVHLRKAGQSYTACLLNAEPAHD